VRSLEIAFVVPARANAVRSLDLLGVGEALAAELQRDRQQRSDLAGEPSASLRLQVAALDVVQQRSRLVGEPRRVERLLRLDRGGRLRRPDIAFDDLRLVLRQPKRELEIAVREAQRSKRAA
jgi:hypothetical protein